MKNSQATHDSGGSAKSADVSIVAAGPEHLHEIAELAATIWRAHYPGIISTEQIEYMLARMYNVRELHDEITQRGVSIDRLLRGTVLIGFASYGPTGEPGELKLHKLYLHPDEQRKGYGTLLLKHVEEAARAGHYQSLMLAVNKQNRGAVEAYQRNGFVTRESVTVSIGGGFVMDDFIMVKILNEG